MLFSSSIFLFVFLPIVLLAYYGPLRGKRRGQNVFLTISSLFFYAWGEPWFVLVMIGAIASNYALGLWVSEWKARGKSLKLPVTTTVVLNLSLLFVFKYLTFVLTNLRGIGLPLMVPIIELPIGISFFTFQAMSYVLDVSRGHGQAQRNILNVGLYISFFPQLIAGPIVKYETVADQIMNRRENWDDFSAGVSRFLMGMGKKVLLSNQLAVVADGAFSAADRSVTFAWLGAICYILQLYYDFGGYSDMAIGLGKLFGFHFLENFNYPFTATSITDFWRRWHISLTSWFRDYVFFPLGGSRVDSRKKLVRNYFVVWLLTGIWHGANWTFMVWGLLNFALLMWEKFGGLGRGAPRWVGWLYTQAAFVLTCVVFRADNIGAALQYLLSMFRLDSLWSPCVETGFYLREYWLFLLLALLCAMPTATWLRRRVQTLAVGKWSKLLPCWDGLSSLCLFFVFFLSAAFLIKGTYNPFIYFNF